MKTDVFLGNMFSAACYQFVKSVGRKTLHPVPSIDEGDNVKPLQLVLKTTKRRFIFFEKANYSPSEFQLTDILTDASPLKTTSLCERLISDYNRTTKLSLKGKFGADISKEIIDIELEASDSITIDIKFGEVAKTEIVEQELLEALSGRCINLDHPYVKQIRRDKKNVLCIITAVSQLANGGTIHRDTEVDASASLKAALMKEGDVSAGETYGKDRNIVLPPKTPVAYHLHELDIDKRSGAIQLVLATGNHGGFKASIGYDEVDASSVDTDTLDAGSENREKLDLDLRHPREIFLPLLQLPEQQRREITDDLLYLLSFPRDLTILADMVERTEEHQQNKIKVTGLVEKLVSDKERWLRILQFAGYKLENDELVQPLTDPPVLKCVGELLDAASELDDEILQLITQLPSHVAEPLLKVIPEGIRGNSVHDPAVVRPLVDDEASSKLLLELQYRVQVNQIQEPIELPYAIDEIYWILYALWGKE